MKFVSNVSRQLADWFSTGSKSACLDDAPEIQLQSLEERVLYSAAPVPLDLVAEPSVDANFEQMDQQLDFLDHAVEELQHESTSDGQLQLDEDEYSIDDLANFAQNEQSLRELVIIDKGVDGWEALYDDVIANDTTGAVTVRLIETDVDGVAALTEILAESASSNVTWSALHIVSHGDNGQVNLGNAVLDSDSIADYSDEIAQWQSSLAFDADILIYGCDLAADDNGESLVDEISSLSGANVAASDDLTGHATLGGDWDLEYTAGLVDSDVVFSVSLIDSWNETLQTTLGDESGTSHSSIAASFNGSQTIVASTDESGVWQVEVSRFETDGETPLTLFDGSDFVDFAVSDPTESGDHQNAVVGSAANGDFAVAWTRSENGTSEVLVKVFSANGNVLHEQFAVAPGANSFNATIATNQQGNFVVGWQEDEGNGVISTNFATFNRWGDPIQVATEAHTDGGLTGDLVVSINDANQVVLAYADPDTDLISVWMHENGTLFDAFVVEEAGIVSVSDIAIDINDSGVVGIAFVAQTGFPGLMTQDIFSYLLQYDGSGVFVNISPDTNLPGFTFQAFAHSGSDFGVESAPSIAVLNNEADGSTRFLVTWQGHGSWQSNLDSGSVVDASGNLVTDAASFPSGSVLADNGVFISETTSFGFDSFTQEAERSLQNDLASFNTNSEFTSVSAFQNRTEFATVFQSATADIESSSSNLNLAPAAEDSSVQGLENFGLSFTTADFGFSDPENDPISRIRIESLPAVGELTLFNNTITQAQLDNNPDGIEVSVNSIGQLRYLGPTDTYGSNLSEFQFSVNDGENWSIAPATMTLSLGAEDRLWVSTVGDSSSTTGIPGDGSGTLQFGGPPLEFGDDTAGYWSQQFAPQDLEINAVHYVDETIQVGTGGGVNLNVGDILFSSSSSSGGILEPVGPASPAPGVVTMLPSIDGSLIEVTSGDIVRFRPTSADYSTGTYEIVVRVENLYGSVTSDYDVTAFSLVEQDTIVGDRLIQKGDFLISDSERPGDILLLEVDATGETSTGDLSLLISGAEVGVDGTITGLDLIEATTSAGGEVLPAGSILASVDATEKVGSAEELSVQAHDVFVLDVASTSYNGSPALATASAFFDGSDVGGDPLEPNTGIDAVSLLGAADTVNPVLVPESSTLRLAENQAWRFDAEDFVTETSVSSLDAVAITLLPDAAIGKLVFRGVDVVEGQAIPADELEFLVFEPEVDAAGASLMFKFRAASSSEVLPERMISIQIASDALDFNIGSGDAFEEVLTMDNTIAAEAGDQTQQQVAALSDGGYVVVWLSQDGASEQILIQRYSPNHEPVGSQIEFFDNDDVNGKSDPAIVGFSDGGFAVTATQNNGIDNDVWGARFNADGMIVDLETGLIPATVDVVAGGPGDQNSGSITRLHNDGLPVDPNDPNSSSITRIPDDGIVVAYEVDHGTHKEIVANVIHGDFTNEVLLSRDIPGSDVSDVSIEALKQGGFVATWINRDAGGTVEARFFDINGIPSSDFTDLGTNANSAPSVTVLNNNQVAIVWTEDTTGDSAGDTRVVGALLNADGTLALPAGEVTITQTDAVNVDPDVSALSDGGFVVAIGDGEIDSSLQSIASYRFDESFALVGTPQVLGLDNFGSQASPDVTTLDSGQVVVVWNTNAGGAGLDIESNAYRFVSTAPVGERINLNLTSETIPGVSDQRTNLTITGLDPLAKLYGINSSDGLEVEVFGPPFNLNSVNLDSVELLLPPGESETLYQLNATVVENGAPSLISQEMVAQSVGDSKTISGRVLNDENADGLVNDAAGFEGATVYLYAGASDFAPLTTTTDADGFYEFTGLVEGTYFVAVDSQSIGFHSVAGADADEIAANQSRVWAEQTYGGAGSINGDLGDTQSAGFLFGGRYEFRSDDASSLESSEHVNRQALSADNANATNVDFGFSFNVVTNVQDALDDGDADLRTVQGSLRQFIDNANFITGPNEMRFVPVAGPNASSDGDNNVTTGDSWWRINAVDVLPEIFGSGTTLDGQAWAPGADGLVELDHNDFTVRNSFTGTVGARGVDFLETDAPELELVGNEFLDHGFRVVANSVHTNTNDVTISNFSIHGFGEDGTGSQILVFRSSAATDLSNVTIENNVIGSGPNDLVTELDTPDGLVFGIALVGAGDGVISNNIIVGQTSSGINIAGQASNATWTIVDNEIAGNATLSSRMDGINTVNLRTATILRNAIHGNHGIGIDNFAVNPGSGEFTIEDNSIFDNGRGGDPEGSGIRLVGDNAVVRYNSIYENQYDGITISGRYDMATGVFVPGTENLISENSFFANGQDDIDLKYDLLEGLTFNDYDSNGDGEISFAESFGALQNSFGSLASLVVDDGVISDFEIDRYLDQSQSFGDGDNPLDSMANADTANNGLDAVIINSAVFDFGNLDLSFEITNPDTDRIELYVTQPGDMDSTPEAWQYFRTIPVSSMTDEGGGIFSVTIPASAFPDDIPQTTPILALAFDANNNTSEFGEAATPVFANHAPVSSPSMVTTLEDQAHFFAIEDFSFSDPDFDQITDIIIRTLPGDGVLMLNGNPIASDDSIPVASIGGLWFEPDENFFGSTSFEFAVSDGSLTSGTAPMTIVVDNVSDAPAGKDSTITVLEDGVFDTFDQTTFGFGDPDDFPMMDDFAAVEIISLNGTGSLETSTGDAVGTVVSVADLADLEYRPGANQHGTGIAQIEFRVIDTGSGSNMSAIQVLSVDVTSVSDNPVGESAIVPIVEDQLVQFTKESFGFSDPIDGDTFAGVIIDAFNGSGSLTIDGNNAAGMTIPEADLSRLQFRPAEDASGDGISSIEFRVVDNGATDNVDLEKRVLTYNVAPASDRPVGQDGEETINEDTVLTFTESTFGFLDLLDNPADSFAGVKIVSFSGIGALTLDGNPVAAGQIVTAAELANLLYSPGADQNGSEIATIRFRVSDSGDVGANEDAEERELKINVTAVSDAPEGTSTGLSVDEDGVLGFDEATFGFSDPVDNGADLFESVRIVGLSGPGTLELNGVAVDSDVPVLLADLPNLLYRPAPNEFGPGFATIDFQVIDSGQTDNEDTTPNTITINVAPVADAPVGVNSTVSVDEDTPLNFTDETFGFSDPIDNEEHSFAGVRIVSFTGTGTLKLGTTTVAMNQIITAAELSSLVYEPPANTNGDGLATIQFQVMDDGVGGSAIDATVRDLTINVNAVADNPTGITKTVLILEDETVTFDQTSFGFDDAADGDAFAGVRIVDFEVGSGTLMLNGAAVTGDQLIDVADLPNLVYQPGADANGPGLATIDFKVVDSGLSNNEDINVQTLTYDVEAQHDAPTGANGSSSVVEDGVLNFTPGTFGFSDAIDDNTDAFDGVRIISFSGDGTLTRNGAPVVAGAIVSATDLPGLEYRPLPNNNGTAQATIEFRVIDDGVSDNQDLTTRLLTIDVTAEPDAPVGSSRTESVTEDGVLNFDETTFGFADPIDGDSFDSVRIVNFDGVGTLTLNGEAVIPGDLISAADLPNLEYRPPADVNGTGLATIDFRVIDSGVSNNQSTATEVLTIDVTPVHDAPIGNPGSVAVDEDGVLNFDENTFGFSDPVDGNSDVFDGVRIISYTGDGALTLNGVDVSDNDLISAADLPNLEYRPAADENGNAVATIDYRVVDTGANNNQDITTRTLTIDVTPVGDAPVGQNMTVATAEGTPLGFDESTFGFSDPVDFGEHNFAGVRIVSFSGNGTLMLNGSAVAANQDVAVADLPNLVYQPDANDNGTAVALIQFRVIDDGTTGVQIDETIRELQIDVTSVSDNPEGVTRTLTISEDQEVTFDASSFGFSDASDGDAFAGVRIVGFNGSGGLTLNGVDVVAGDVVSATDIGQLRFQPDLNDNGTSLSTIDFRVVDSGVGNNEDLLTRTLTFDVDPVADAPTGASQTIDIGEDTTHAFDPSDFGFFDVDGDAFSAVRIVALNGPGELALNGVAIAPGTVVAEGDLVGLTYTPPANQHGDGLASVEFRVIDDSAANNEDIQNRTIVFDVQFEDDPPTGQSRTLPVAEDGSLGFTESSFGFDAVDGTPFGGVRIVSFSGSGSLQLNGIDVAAGSVVSAADLVNLIYQPGANENGIDLAQIQFRVIDSSDDNNEDLNTQTLTIDVTPEHDAPTGISKDVRVREDGVLSFDEDTFGFSDSVDGDTDVFDGVRIVSFDGGGGTLTLNGLDVSANDVISATDLPNLEYRPPANENGDAFATIDFRVIDDGADDNQDTETRTLTINVRPQDDTPTGESATVEVFEDEPTTFTTESFGYDAVDGNPMAGVRIVSFSGSGSLTLDGIDVAPGTIVDVADLSRLTFQPGQDEFGTGISQIDFRVIDDSATNNEDPITRTLTYNVVEVNDAPVGTSSTLSTREDQPLGFAPSDFGFDDSIDDGIYQFEAVRIMDFMGQGTLQFQGVDVVPGQVVLVNDLDSLIYHPEGNENGFGLSTVQFRVIDDGDGFNEDTTTRSLTIDVESLDDAPTGQSNTVTIIEDEPFAFTPTDFGFEDANDLVPNNFEAVRIVDVNGNGTLTLDGVTVSPNTVVDVADISRLEYTPPANGSGDATATVEFRVIDDGSNGPGEANQDVATRVLTFNVLEVNDAPEIEAAVFTNVENTIGVHQFTASDLDGDALTFSRADSGTANDNALFRIGDDGQSLQFVSAPDFEDPQSISGDNTYFVDVAVTDVHGASSIERIEVQVLNVDESIDLVEDMDLIVVSGSSLGSVLTNDNAGQPLPANANFEVLSQPDSGTVTFNEDGTFEFSQTSSTLESEVEFTYTVENGGEVTEAVASFRQGGPAQTGGGNTPGNSGSGDDGSDESLNDDLEIGDSIDKEAIDSSLVNNRPGSTTTNGNADSGTRIISNNNGSGANTANTDINDVQFSIDTSNANASSLYTSYAYAKFVDTSLLSTELASSAVAVARAGLEEFTADFAFTAAFWQELDSASENFVITDVGEIETAIVAGSLVTTVAFGVLVRTALLVGSFGATYVNPWWTTFDILPLIKDEEEESIEQIVDNDDDAS